MFGPGYLPARLRTTGFPPGAPDRVGLVMESIEARPPEIRRFVIDLAEAERIAAALLDAVARQRARSEGQLADVRPGEIEAVDAADPTHKAIVCAFEGGTLSMSGPQFRKLVHHAAIHGPVLGRAAVRSIVEADGGDDRDH